MKELKNFQNNEKDRNCEGLKLQKVEGVKIAWVESALIEIALDEMTRDRHENVTMTAMAVMFIATIFVL